MNGIFYNLLILNIDLPSINSSVVESLGLKELDCSLSLMLFARNLSHILWVLLWYYLMLRKEKQVSDPTTVIEKEKIL